MAYDRIYMVVDVTQPNQLSRPAISYQGACGLSDSSID
jgi:hypothetical protein